MFANYQKDFETSREFRKESIFQIEKLFLKLSDYNDILLIITKSFVWTEMSVKFFLKTNVSINFKNKNSDLTKSVYYYLN